MTQDQWQPIETAPTDGVWVMAFEPNEVTTQFDCTHWITHMYHNGQWMDQDDCLVVRNPTHWLPLPEAPKDR